MELDKLTEIFKRLDTYYVANSINTQNIDIDTFSDKIASFIRIIEFWTQALGLLLAKCENHKKRKNIINNLYDENCQDMTHVETFYAFLSECSDKAPLDIVLTASKNNQTISKFITIMKNFISNNTFEDSCEVLGSAEYIYSLISEDVNELFYKYKNIHPKFHYVIKKIDTKHATDLFDCSEKIVSEHNLYFGADWITGIINELVNQ
jgi:hypothetical protein